MAVKPIPEGYHTATPYLIIQGAAKAIEFYKQAFEATELMRLDSPGGKIGVPASIPNIPILVMDMVPPFICPGSVRPVRAESITRAMA